MLTVNPNTRDTQNMIKWRWPSECTQVGNGGLKLERSWKCWQLLRSWHDVLIIESCSCIILPMNLWLHLNKEHQIVSKIHDSNWGSYKPWWVEKLDSNDLRHARKQIPFLRDVGCSDGFLLQENMKWLKICLKDLFGEKKRFRKVNSKDHACGFTVGCDHVSLAWLSTPSPLGTSGHPGSAGPET